MSHVAKLSFDPLESSGTDSGGVEDRHLLRIQLERVTLQGVLRPMNHQVGWKCRMVKMREVQQTRVI